MAARQSDPKCDKARENEPFEPPDSDDRDQADRRPRPPVAKPKVLFEDLASI